MAGPIVLASALSSIMTLECPHCGYKKVFVTRIPHSICPRCKRQLPPPPRKRRR